MAAFIFAGVTVEVVIPYRLQTAINCVLINRDNFAKMTLLLTNIFANQKRHWQLAQKYCNGFTLSFQQQQKILRKELFHATLALCKSKLVKDHVSQPLAELINSMTWLSVELLYFRFATITLNFVYNELSNTVDLKTVWLSCGLTLT